MDVGGIEYLIDDRDGRHYFYDVNALSNFVADARNVIGFDPHERLVDYLLLRATPRVPARPRQETGDRRQETEPVAAAGLQAALRRPGGRLAAVVRDR